MGFPDRREKKERISPLGGILPGRAAKMGFYPEFLLPASRKCNLANG
jgi:hypothetical protein